MKIKFLLGFIFFSLMQNTIKASDTLGCYNGYEFEPEIFDRAEVMPSFSWWMARISLFHSK
jgi:hypothetical protein